MSEQKTDNPKKATQTAAKKKTSTPKKSSQTATKKKTSTTKKSSQTTAKKKTSTTKKSSQTTAKKKTSVPKSAPAVNEKKSVEPKENIQTIDEKKINKPKMDEQKIEKRVSKTLKGIVIVILISCLVFLSVSFVRSDLFKHSVIEKGLELKNLSNVTYSNNNVYALLETYDLILPKNLWCIATKDETVPDFSDEDWQKISDDSCNLKIDDDDIYIYIRDTKNVSKRYVISDYISYIAKISIPQNNIKLVKDESQEINASIKTIGNPNTTLLYSSDDESIAKVEDGKIIGVNDGTTKINISDDYGNKETIDVEVTSLVTVPTINNSKPFIRYKQYTEEQAKTLDEYLFYDVEKAGDKTRAGVVAAARFLTLKFKYRIPYFLENGRVTHFNHQRPYCDGEGRYYHKGLYLSTDKYADLEKSVAGPTMWGGMIREYSTDNGIMPNGLDCSGFVCWCLRNGGFDFGDIGGGLSEGGVTTLSDIGIMKRITMDLLNSHTVKAGDLVMLDGHIGIIIGIDDESVYVADTLYYWKGTWVTKFSYRGLVNSTFTHIIDMSELYKDDGNYTAMW